MPKKTEKDLMERLKRLAEKIGNAEDLFGKPNKKEKEMMNLLTKWHNPKRIARLLKKDKRKIKLN